MGEYFFPGLDTALGSLFIVHAIVTHPREGNNILAANFLSQVNTIGETFDNQIVIVRIAGTLSKSMIPGDQRHLQAHLHNRWVVFG